MHSGFPKRRDSKILKKSYNKTMNLLFLMNAFKGTLTSKELNSMLEDYFMDDETESIPFSDGGDGFSDMMKSLLGKQCRSIETEVHSPYLGKTRKADYLLFEKEAYLESAAAIGYRLEERKDVLHATSYPLGEMIKDALDHEANEINIGLGGSITNDMGSGILEALGVRFYDSFHNIIHPMGNNLDLIQDMDLDRLDPRVENVKFCLFSDVTNPLLGKNGATYVYARQKGASEEDLPKLEKGMENLASVYQKKCKKNLQSRKGTGAAGGIPMAFLSFMDATIVSGADFLLSQKKTEEKLKEADLIFTGEGRLDSSSLSGKGSVAVLEKRDALGSKAEVVLLVGSIEEETKQKLLKKYSDLRIIKMVDNALFYPISIRRKKASEIFRATLKMNFCLDQKKK